MLILGQKSCFLGPNIFEIPKLERYYYVYLFLCSDGLFDSNIPTHIIVKNEQIITIGSFTNFISIHEKKKIQLQLHAYKCDTVLKHSW